jgi:hypothetical protein
MKNLKLMGLSVFMIFSTIYPMDGGGDYKGYGQRYNKDYFSTEFGVYDLTVEEIEDYKANSDYEKRIVEGSRTSLLDEHIMDLYPKDKAIWKSALNERFRREYQEDREQETVFLQGCAIQEKYKIGVEKIDQERNDNRIKILESDFPLEISINNTLEKSDKLNEIASKLQIEEKNITKELLKTIIMNDDQEKRAIKNIKKISKEFNNYLSGQNQSSQDQSSIIHTNDNNSFIIESIRKFFNQFKNYFFNPSFDIIMTINNNIKRDDKLASVIPMIEEKLKKTGINPQYINIESIIKNDDKNGDVVTATTGIKYRTGKKKFSNVHNTYIQSLDIHSIDFGVGIDPLIKTLEALSLCTIAHEIQHLKEAHSVKVVMLELYREHYKKTAKNTDEKTKNTIDALMNKFDHITETIADTLPFIKDSGLALSQKERRAKRMYMGHQIALDSEHYKRLSQISEIHEQNQFIVQNYLTFNSNRQ